MLEKKGKGPVFDYEFVLLEDIPFASNSKVFEDYRAQKNDKRFRVFRVFSVNGGVSVRQREVVRDKDACILYINLKAIDAEDPFQAACDKIERLRKNIPEFFVNPKRVFLISDDDDFLIEMGHRYQWNVYHESDEGDSAFQFDGDTVKRFNHIIFHQIPDLVNLERTTLPEICLKAADVKGKNRSYYCFFSREDLKDKWKQCFDRIWKEKITAFDYTGYSDIPFKIFVALDRNIKKQFVSMSPQKQEVLDLIEEQFYRVQEQHEKSLSHLESDTVSRTRQEENLKTAYGDIYDADSEVFTPAKTALLKTIKDKIMEQRSILGIFRTKSILAEYRLTRLYIEIYKMDSGFYAYLENWKNRNVGLSEFSFNPYYRFISPRLNLSVIENAAKAADAALGPVSSPVSK